MPGEAPPVAREEGRPREARRRRVIGPTRLRPLRGRSRPPRQAGRTTVRLLPDLTYPGGCRGLARETAPLARSNAVVGVARHERHGRRLHHAVVLADHAALAALVVLDNDCPLQHRSNANLLAVDHRIEAAADLVVGWWDDAGQ